MIRKPCAVCREPRPLIFSICAECFSESNKRGRKDRYLKARCSEEFEAMAKAKAKEDGKDFSEYMRDLIIADCAS